MTKKQIKSRKKTKKAKKLTKKTDYKLYKWIYSTSLGTASTLQIFQDH